MVGNQRNKAYIWRCPHVPVFSNKKGFTLLELVIVIIIISILMVSLKSSFQIKNKDILYGQACIENIYGQVNNFMHAWISSKSLYTTTGGKIFPDQYIFNFSTLGQKITLLYNSGGVVQTYKTISLSGNSNIAYCSSEKYMIKLSGDSYTWYINKGLEEINMQMFYLTGSKFMYTWETKFIQCDKDGTWCIYIGRFESDTRTISIRKQICLDFSDTGAALTCAGGSGRDN